MNVDCRWFNAHLEGFFCESLGVEDFQLASEHVKTCESCRNGVKALHEADPIIRQVMEYRTEKARLASLAPRRIGGFQIGVAVTALAAAAVLAFAVYTHVAQSPAGPQPAAPTMAQNPGVPNNPDGKTDTSASVDRAKPDAPSPKSPAGNSVPEPAVSENALAFQVMNPEGHDMNLQDYRGRVLLFGIWSEDQPEAALNLQRLYQALGTRHELRILGISGRNQNRIVGTTFPIAFNNGSRLLETPSSDFTVVDKEGTVRMRGSLKGNVNALIPQIKAKLDELGGR